MESGRLSPAHAVFGLLNSTPHSMKAGDNSRTKAPVARSRAVMRAMTVAALRAADQCQ